jgi:RHS repeat-associated protein
MSVTVNPATNRITNAGMSYDASGNLTSMPGLTMTYDTDNRMYSNSSGDSYLYDAAGQRVKKTNGATTALYFYGVDGKLLYDWPNGYSLYFGNKLIFNSSQGSDRTAVVTDRLGSVVKKDLYSDSRYFPYGDEASATQQNRPKFATYYRDGSTALDYAQQRYYASTLGRFTTPDPYQASGGPADPQSWNRYAYVQNDPVNFNDPSGLYRCYMAVPDWAEGPVDVCFFGGDGKRSYMMPDLLPEIGGGGGGSGADPSSHYMPPLEPRDRKTAHDALRTSEKIIGSLKDCDSVLSDKGIPSLKGLISGVNVDTNVFDGRTSSAPNDKYGTVAALFKNEGTKIGAIVAMNGGPSSNAMYLGPAFFDPRSFGALADRRLVQGFMMIHEAVHLIGNLRDADFGGSKALTKLLVDNCYPILGKTGGLGSLYD